MSEYITVRNFWDTEVRTEEYPRGKSYKKGEKFPAEGLKVSEERLRQLSTYDNSAGEIFIKKVDENKETINPFKDEETETEEESTEEVTETEEESTEEVTETEEESTEEVTETEEESTEEVTETEEESTEKVIENKKPKEKKASTRGRRKKAD
jgi:hypothetical protein